jgi:hypothetical protein
MRHELARLLGRGVERQRMVGALGFDERHLLVRAIDRARGREHEMPRRLAAHDLEQIEGAVDIRAHIGFGIFEAVAHARLCGEMHDHIGIGALVNGGELLRILDVRDMRGEAVRAREDCMALFLQLDIVIGRQRIDALHVMAVGEQPFRKMKADEARGARDQKAHSCAIAEALSEKWRTRHDSNV